MLVALGRRRCLHCVIEEKSAGDPRNGQQGDEQSDEDGQATTYTNDSYRRRRCMKPSCRPISRLAVGHAADRINHWLAGIGCGLAHAPARAEQQDNRQDRVDTRQKPDADGHRVVDQLSNRNGHDHDGNPRERQCVSSD
jgi:hypothetical protein